VKDKSEKPRFYLIQFGPEAKLKSFLVLHELYRAQVPLIHSIVKDKLGSQIHIVQYAVKIIIFEIYCVRGN
jgi:hypothetical protein